MMRLVSDSVPSIEGFMRRYKVRFISSSRDSAQFPFSWIFQRLNIAFQSVFPRL
jgi:hypothetical protein